MRRYFSIATVLAGVAIVCGVRAQARESKPTTGSDRPLWEIDLRQFGYERWLRRSTRPLPLFVDFTDVDHLAVGWIRPDIPHVDGRRAPLGPEPAHLNVVILDAKTGQKQSKTEWPTSARYFSAPLFFGIPDGRLLICSDNVLRLLSPTLEVVREQELPNHASCVNVAFQHSPSRRTLLVTILSEHSRQMELLGVETLAILSSWTEERAASATFMGILSISDHWLAGYCGEPTELCLRRFDKGWQPFHPNGRALVYGIKDRRNIFSLKMKGTSPWTPWDVHDNYLALSPNGTHLAVLSDGVLKIYPLPSDSAEQH